MKPTYYFENRIEAGKKLADYMKELGITKGIVIALPRGGVPVARVVAQELNLPMDIVIVRKIGTPFNEEYGIGAVCENEKPLFRASDFIDDEKTSFEIKKIIEKEIKEIKRRVFRYRGSRPLINVRGKEVILIDDGLATGVTAAAAAKYMKEEGATKVTLAVPVAPNSDNAFLSKYVSQVISLHRPENFTAVGLWYKNFSALSDEDVIYNLKVFQNKNNNQKSANL